MNKFPRLLGFFFTLIGMVCFLYFGAILPVESINLGYSSIPTAAKLIIVMPATLTLGLIFLVFGRTATDVIGEPDDMTIMGWITIAALIVAGLYLNVQFEVYLKNMGYFSYRLPV